MTPVSSAPMSIEALRAMYPESDGKPMSDNMKQGRWIAVLYGNLCELLADRDDAFVAPDNLWYPVEGHPEERQAPDVYVVFGRPKGDRGSYMQWLENHVPITVVFEVLSPNNSDDEMARKFHFYDEHGVEEYYVYDPDHNKLQIYTRGKQTLRLHHDIAKFTSPRLGIRFEMTRPEMTVYGPDGERFLRFEELQALYKEQVHQADDARRQADDARRQADDARSQADDARRQADDARRQADDANRRASRLAELGKKARRNQASAEELAELERLEEGPG